MSDREIKKQLVARVNRFLFSKVEWEADSRMAVSELRLIVDRLIDAKFEGGSDRVIFAVSDTRRSMSVFTGYPLPNEDDPPESQRRRMMSAMNDLTAGLQRVNLDLSALDAMKK